MIDTHWCFETTTRNNSTICCGSFTMRIFKIHLLHNYSWGKVSCQVHHRRSPLVQGGLEISIWMTITMDLGDRNGQVTKELVNEQSKPNVRWHDVMSDDEDDDNSDTESDTESGAEKGAGEWHWSLASSWSCVERKCRWNYLRSLTIAHAFRMYPGSCSRSFVHRSSLSCHFHLDH